LRDFDQVASKPACYEPAQKGDEKGDHGEVAILVMQDYNRLSLLLNQSAETFLPLAKCSDTVDRQDYMSSIQALFLMGFLSSGRTWGVSGGSAAVPVLAGFGTHC
jgi:hypothetical protein